MLGLLIRVEPTTGQSHREWAADVIKLCKNLDCGLMVKANGIDVGVYPGDTPEEIEKRYHMLRKIVEQ